MSSTRGQRRKMCQSYPATASSVSLARRQLARFAAEAGAQQDQIEAVRLAASETVTNIVLHGYESEAGHVHVDADVTTDELSVQVADDGAGLRPRLERRGLGLGLALIAQASEELDIVTRPAAAPSCACASP